MKNKNIKQQNLLNKSKHASKKRENPLAASLKDFKNSQTTRKVHYTDIHGNKQLKNITVNDPGINDASKVVSYLNSNNPNNILQAYNIILKDVIITPHLSFASEDQKFPKSLKKKVITTTTNEVQEKVPLKNKSGQKVQINLKWPGYHAAFYIINSMMSATGDLRLNTILHLLNRYVFKDDDGHSVKDSYWNVGGHCSGLGFQAMKSAINWLTSIVDYDGFNQMIQSGISFLTQAV